MIIPYGIICYFNFKKVKIMYLNYNKIVKIINQIIVKSRDCQRNRMTEGKRIKS